MKKILISLAAASALAAVAAPAVAQPYGGYDRGPGRGGYDMVDRGERLEMRIQRSLANGQLTRREAARLRSEVRATEQLAWRYRRDGAFTRWERSNIQQRYDRIAMRLRYERNDRDYGYGYGERYRR